MADYEQYGLRNLSLLSPKSAMCATFRACSWFSLLFAWQHMMHLEKLILDMSDFTEDVPKSFPSYPLCAQAQISEGSSVELIMTYDTTSVADAQIQALSNQLGHVIRQLCEMMVAS